MNTVLGLRVDVLDWSGYIGVLEINPSNGNVYAVPMLEHDIALMAEALDAVRSICACFVGLHEHAPCEYWNALACIEADEVLASYNDLRVEHREPFVMRCCVCRACTEHSAVSDFDRAYAAYYHGEVL